MIKRLLLVDLENVHKIDLSLLKELGSDPNYY